MDFFARLQVEADPFLASTMAAVRIREILSRAGLPDLANPDDVVDLVDPSYYVKRYGHLIEKIGDPYEHYFTQGAFEGTSPNFYFDSSWYLSVNPDVAEAKINPLVHYALYGEREGRSPSLLFDPQWYRRRYDLSEDECALAHYMRHRATGAYSPFPEFDVPDYLARHPDIAQAKVDPVEHYVEYGYREGRNPSNLFDTNYYLWSRLGGKAAECPLLHYLAHRHEPGARGAPDDNYASVAREVRRFTQPSAYFEEFQPAAEGKAPQAKVLAYYLPQFHSFPENDAWWGKGFTEWTNLGRGLPRFQGHYQPRIPRDLGFYNLESVQLMKRQIELARASGIYGFIYYYYWFNGKRLMDRPLDGFLADPGLDMPFCIMWANENWTRRWDGAESEILISQDYDEADDEGLCADIARHFKDPRYIRIDGRPLFFLYRASSIPNAAGAVARWRSILSRQHREDPIFVSAQAFGDNDPASFGMDGAIEFPPHKIVNNLRTQNQSLHLLDYEFKGQAYSYEDVVRSSLDDAPSTSLPVIKTAIPSWDNDARRQGAGLVITGSTPEQYESWLAKLIKRAQEKPFFGESFVCVNAWNEWCEGAYLEPDLHFGAAYLNATSRAVFGRARKQSSRVLLVGHDAFSAGAQYLLLNIGRTLKRTNGVEVQFLLLDGGALKADYEKVAKTHIISESLRLRSFLKEMRQRGFGAVIVNTAATAHVAPLANDAGLPPILLIHEMPRMLAERNLVRSVQRALECGKRIVFAAPTVRDLVLKEAQAEPRLPSTLILPQGVYRPIAPSDESARRLRQEFSIATTEPLVIGVGYGDLRKGFDLFIQVWRLLQSALKKVHFIWVGDVCPHVMKWLGPEVESAAETGTFHVTGFRDDVDAFYAAADCFVLTSREDPYPSVVLEAMSAGLPAIAFDKAGGIPDLLKDTSFGEVAPFCDTVAMARAVREALDHPLSSEERNARREYIRNRFDFQDYAADLLELSLPGLRRVSAAVPNYNYARYMPERLGSVFAQTYPIREVIVLDDCSSDDSLEAIQKTAAHWERDIRLVANDVNSGSVFSQWRKAALLAKGDFVWIAEADDSCDAEFLEELIPFFDKDEQVKFVFSDSRTVDADGSPQWDSYKSYYATVAPDALSKSAVFDGAEFVAKYLSVKNVILNASSVVWRRASLLAALDACETALSNYRFAGDWVLYLTALSQPNARVGYNASALNVHRRHGSSVTHSTEGARHIDEIARVHALIAELFPRIDEASKKQSAYRDELRDQFGLQAAESV
ncbi:glycoside hydrolase family 99-like domain-containing protein [Methylocystis sp. JAN1]|uniref:glycoside hydrolase family 99-like domain-containing protein n=1 Tax=Methylocystis sp. JAN1 TaxID=3397211 RepID=UPI003FA2B33C